MKESWQDGNRCMCTEAGWSSSFLGGFDWWRALEVNIGSISPIRASGSDHYGKKRQDFIYPMQQ